MSLSPLSRRQLISAVPAVALLAAIPARAQDATPAATPAASPVAPDGPWSFTDDRGTELTALAIPQRIVTNILAGSALYDFGITPVGIYGVTRRADGTPEPHVGGIDLESTPNLGEVTFEFDLEGFVALDADLLVGITYAIDDPVNLWSIDPAAVEILQGQVAIAAIEVNNKPVNELIQRYQDLAASLGIDTGSKAITSARAAFDATSETLRTAIEARPGLRVLVMSANQESIYPVAPTPADLAYFASLGLDIVVPDQADTSGMSWENALKYPADVILNETRAGWFTNEQLAAHETFRFHPAVEAGQIGNRSNSYVASWQGFVPVMERLTATIEASRVVTG